MLFFIPISISLIEIFSSFLLFSFAMRKIIKPDFKFLKSLPNLFLLLFLISSALSLFNSGSYIRISISTLLIKWTRYILFCIVIQDGIYDSRIMKRAVSVFLFGAFLVVLSGFSQYFLGFEFLRHNKTIIINCGWPAITSSMGHYNDFGGYLVVVLSLIVTLLLSDNCYGLKAVSLLVYAVMSLAAITLTFSRGSWVSLAASFVFMFIFARRNLWKLLPVLLLVVAISFLPEVRERSCLTFLSGGDSHRVKYWTAAMEMIRDHPILGIGLGTFMSNFHKYVKVLNISYAHNCYLQIWAETGMLGFISFVLFIGSFLYIGIKRLTASVDFILLGLLSGMIGFLVHSFLDTNLYSLQLAVLFWICVGMILRLCREDIR